MIAKYSRHWPVVALFLAGASLPLAACSDSDWAHAMTYADVRSGTPSDTNADVPIPPRPASVRGYTDRSCEDAAQERSSEVSDQGFDDDVQHVVHDKVLAECNAFWMKTQ